MNKTTILTLALTVMLLAVGCHRQKHDSDLTDAQRLEMLDLQLEKHPKDATLLAKRAKVLLNLHRTSEALFDINRAVTIDPDNVEYQLLKADIHFASGDIQGSYKALGEAEKLDPDSREVQLKMGEVTFYSRDYERSLRHLTNVTEREPDNRTALFMKGFIYKEQGDTANAVVLLRRVCDIYPDYEPAFEELGVLYAARGNALAEEYLSTAMRLDPNNTNACYAMAMYCQESGQYDRAIEFYQHMLDINPASADAWHNMGYIELTVNENYQQALEYFDKALQADSTHQAAAFNRDLTLQMIKK